MTATSALMIILRFLHIVSGVLWVGSAFLFVGFIGPSAAEVGPSAGPLLSVAVKKRKVAKVISILGMVTVTAGWLMWARNADTYGSIGNWVETSFGLGITIGAVLATITFFVGYYGVGKNVERMVDLGDTIGASGGPPSPEQHAEMERLGGQLEKHGKMDLVLLLLAVTAMATARYW
jgi:uncharacterized membrane protein